MFYYGVIPWGATLRTRNSGNGPTCRSLSFGRRHIDVWSYFLWPGTVFFRNAVGLLALGFALRSEVWFGVSRNLDDTMTFRVLATAVKFFSCGSVFT